MNLNGVYAEGHSQFGLYNNYQLQDAFAGYFGFKMNSKSVWIFENPTYDLSYWHFSGDDGDDTVLSDNEDYVTMESVNDFIVLEGDEYGFDFDNNYNAIKLMTSSSVGDGWTLDMNYGVFRITEDKLSTTDPLTGAAYTAGGGVPRAGNNNDRLGNELDVVLTWDYSNNLSLEGGVGYLFDSGYLKDARDNVVQGGVAAGGTAGAEQGEDHHALWFLNLNLDW